MENTEKVMALIRELKGEIINSHLPQQEKDKALNYLYQVEDITLFGD